MEPPLYTYYDALELYYESYYEQRHARLLNESCHDRTALSKYYNSSNFLNPLCAQIRNMTAYDHPTPRFPTDLVVPPLASVSILCSIASILIAILFFHRLVGAMKKPDKPDHITIALGSSCIIFHVIYNFCDPITFYFYLVDYDYDSYRAASILEETCWGLAKITIYALFAYRYFILSRASIFERSSQLQTLISFGAVICFIFIQLSLQIAYVIVSDLYTNVDWLDTELEHYYLRLYLNIGWMFASVDFAIVGVLGYLIIRTVLRLVIMIDFHSDHTELNENSVASASVASNSTESVASNSVNPFDDFHLSKKKKVKKRKNRRQTELLALSTRLAVTCLYSMISSFVVYATELIIEEAEQYHLSFIAYFWCVDNVINMLCVYFSMAFAKYHYQMVCQHYCFCHQCFYCCLDAVVSFQINEKHEIESEKQLERDGGVVKIVIKTNSKNSELSRSN